MRRRSKFARPYICRLSILEVTWNHAEGGSRRSRIAGVRESRRRIQRGVLALFEGFEKGGGRRGQEPETVEEPWWDRWFPAQDVAPATLEAHAQQYRHHVALRFADVPIGQVTGLDLAGLTTFGLAVEIGDWNRFTIQTVRPRLTTGGPGKALPSSAEATSRD